MRESLVQRNKQKHAYQIRQTFKGTEVEFKEFEPWLKFKPRLKYGWFHLKLYSIFQDLSRRSIETVFLQI